MKHQITHQITQIAKNEDGGTFKISIKIPFEKGWIERVKFSVSTFSRKDAFQMKYVKNENNYAYFETTESLENSALYHYYFSFEAHGKFQYYKKQNITGDTSLSKEECWKMSVGFDVPEWAKGATMYHIFVDRYRKGKGMEKQPMPVRTLHKNWDEPPVLGPNENVTNANELEEIRKWNIDFYGGDLKGIEETLGYIKKLGVDILYLSPIMRSQSNHRYDTADYENVDPYAGTNEILKSLCDRAHQKGMKVILDAVFNHTGNDSIYFNQYRTFENVGAYQSPESPYYCFYRRECFHGNHDFAYWWGMPNLPVCDGNSQKWKDFICGEGGVIDKWFELGIDGLRLDVADELSDEFIEEIARAVKRNKPDGFVLGEVWENNPMNNRGYLRSGKGMHSVMNYRMVDALIRYYKYGDIWKLDNTLKEILSEYPEGTIQTLMNFTSTHDISRAIEIFGCNAFQQYSQWAWDLQNANLDWIKSHKMSREEYKYGKMVYKSYACVLAFWSGIFSIFYGDEVGLQGIGNQANRAPYPWKHRDKDLLKYFRKLGRKRNQEKQFLRKAEPNVIKLDQEQIAYERYDENNKILVIASRTHRISKVDLPEEYKDAKVIFKIKGSNEHQLAPFGAIVFKK